MRKIDRTGEKKLNNQGCLMKIVKYNSNRDIDIEFENGYIIKNKEYKKFKNGNIRNPFYPNVYNVGFSGEGKYRQTINRTPTKEYNCWCAMLQRCYSKKYQEKHPTYIDCFVCSEWHNFQNFAEWFNENYYEVDDKRMELDKDILIKGNKIYSPENCVFVPQNINKLFTKNNNSRGEFPIGVHFNKNANKFESYCNNENGEKIYFGLFDNSIDAFYEYKNFKENIISKVANEYKSKIPEKLYNAMLLWKVEITD